MSLLESSGQAGCVVTAEDIHGLLLTNNELKTTEISRLEWVQLVIGDVLGYPSIRTLALHSTGLIGQGYNQTIKLNNKKGRREAAAHLSHVIELIGAREFWPYALGLYRRTGITSALGELGLAGMPANMVNNDSATLGDMVDHVLKAIEDANLPGFDTEALNKARVAAQFDWNERFQQLSSKDLDASDLNEAIMKVNDVMQAMMMPPALMQQGLLDRKSR